MAKNTDWTAAQDVCDIMEKFLERFPKMFEGFNVEQMHFILTKKKKSKMPIRIKAVGYPNYVFTGKPYVVEAFDLWWKDMTQKQRNLAVFHIMCAVPDGGFDEQSKFYGKVSKPDVNMYTLEYAASGGVINWMENPDAQDPMVRTASDVSGDVPGVVAIPEEINRIPVTRGDLESVTDEESAA